MKLDPISQKLKRVRNLPLLALRVLQGQKPGRMRSEISHYSSRDIIQEVQQRYHFRTFVETGTFQGDMVAAVKDSFDVVYSIELDQALHERACVRFKANPNVRLRQGDSGQVIPQVLRELSTPALFWLDAHYSAGVTSMGKLFSPILEELEHIFRHPIKGHVILIDDYWAFGTMKDYPSMAELRHFVGGHTAQSRITVKNGVIEIDYEPLNVQTNYTSCSGA